MSGPPPMGWPGMPGGPPPGDMQFGWPGMAPPGPVMPPGPGMQLPPNMRPPGMFGFGPPRPGFPPAGFPHPQFGTDKPSHPEKSNDEGQQSQDKNKEVEQPDAAADETVGDSEESQEKMEDSLGDAEPDESGPPAFGGPQVLGPASHGPPRGPLMPMPGPRPGGAWTARMVMPPGVRGPGPGGPGSDFVRGPIPFGHGMGPRAFGPPESRGQPGYDGEDEFNENQEEVSEDYGMEEQADNGNDDEYAEFEGYNVFLYT
jgi:hypothetical protein